MQVFHFDRFNIIGSAQLNIAGKVVAIAPGSEVDTLLVGSNQLGVGSLVPWSPQLRALRGFRFHDNAVNVDEGQPGSRLELLVYEAGDELATPGPRAPSLREAYVSAASMGATVATAVRALRLPFAGRREASIFVRRRDATADVNVVVRGVRYLSRTIMDLAKAGSFSNLHYTDEQVDTLWAGVAGGPLSVITGATDPITGFAMSQVALGRTLHVGGFGDLAEAYDEIEVLLYGAAGGSDLHLMGESRGECA